MNQPQTLKGFRDFSPAQARVRNFVSQIIRSTFEQFGFEPLETPTLEYAETLLKKYSLDTDKETYIFKDLGNRDVGLIYDLTVPTARYLSQNANSIKFPFKRYQMQRCYRAEKPQKGRYREFVQCDIDIFGIKSPQADAEILACGYSVLQKLGFANFKYLINDRNILLDILKSVGIIDSPKQLLILRILDKLPKIGETAVFAELASKNIPTPLTAQIFQKIQLAKPNQALQEIIDLAILMGVPEEKLVFSPTLTRGADYYTGMVVEGVVEEPKIGSILGGGRYNNLIQSFGGPNTPATGFSFGFERICEVIGDLNLLKDRINNYPCKVLVCLLYSPYPPNLPNLPSSILSLAFKTASFLRENNISCQVYLNPQDDLKKQLKFASEKNIPYAIIIGPDEVKKEVVTLKNLNNRTQTESRPDSLLALIS